MEQLITYLDGERGRRAALAKAIGINPGAISQWDRVPTDKLDKVAEFTGIPKNKLRPDIFKGYSADERATA